MLEMLQKGTLETTAEAADARGAGMESRRWGGPGGAAAVCTWVMF